MERIESWKLDTYTGYKVGVDWYRLLRYVKGRRHNTSKTKTLDLQGRGVRS